MDLENMELSPELMAKAKACHTPEEVLALAQEEGYELSDEELEGIVGGWEHPCPKACESGDVRDDIDESSVSAAFMTGKIRGDGLD